jgi:6-phospho-beta-galactosidase
MVDRLPTWNEPFLWGVATSGYQSEGGFNAPGQPQNNWTLSEQQGIAAPSGRAADFWTRYQEDFQACRSMGLNAFRLGLEWARIQPSTSQQPTQPPEFDYTALDGYADRIAACRQAGLEPIVTLFHFTHPAWLGIDAWLNDRTIDLFVEYVRVSVGHINRRLTEQHQLTPIRWLMTLNELNVLAPNTYLSGTFPSQERGITAALRAYNNLLTAHVRAYLCLQALYRSHCWAAPLISLNTCCSDLYWSDKFLWDLLSAKQRGIQSADLREYLTQQAKNLETALAQANLPRYRDFFTPIGQLARHFANRVAIRAIDPHPFDPVLKELAACPYDSVIDYVAIDYYDPFFVNNVRFPSWTNLFDPKGILAGLSGGFAVKCWEWRLNPKGLYFYSRYYAQDLQRPVMIAENGMALRREFDNRVAMPRRDRVTRSQFLELHVAEVQRLLQDGVPLIGYMHWSLTDNYEWSSYAPRFGLFAIDFAQGTDRSVTDHLGDQPSVTYARLVREFGKQQDFYVDP